MDPLVGSISSGNSSIDLFGFRCAELTPFSVSGKRALCGVPAPYLIDGRALCMVHALRTASGVTPEMLFPNASKLARQGEIKEEMEPQPDAESEISPAEPATSPSSLSLLALEDPALRARVEQVDGVIARLKAQRAKLLGEA